MSIYISEIYGPTIQGEGQLIGKPTVFVQVGGCDFRCTWCDSKHSVKPQYRPDWDKMSSEEIFSEIKKRTNGQPILITLTGGNPAMFDFSELIALGHSEGFTFAMETQGSITKPYFADLDYLTVSPKPPSSRSLFDPTKLATCLAAHKNPSLKIVVSDEKDYRFAKRLHKKYPEVPMTLQPCNLQAEVDEMTDVDKLTEQLEWLIEKVQTDGLYQITILPQLHVLLWNNKRGQE